MLAVQKYFDGQADNYQSRSSKSFWAFLRRREEAAVLRKLSPFSGMTCLELGCGSGYYTSLLVRLKPSRLVAVDLSHKMLSSFKTSGILKVQADIQKFSVKIPFDRIVCAGSLEFLSDPSTFFCSVSHALSTDGFLILLLPKKGFAGRVYQLFHLSHGVQIRLFDKVSLNDMISKSGLRLDSIESPTPMAYVLRASHV